MVTLLLSILQVILLAFIIKDEDIKHTLYAIGVVFFINLLSHGAPLFYIRMAGLDILFCFTIFFIKDSIKRILLWIVYLLSFSMNIYEQLSQYQSFFYSYRKEVQWCLIQLMFIIITYNCRWRRYSWKTNKQS